MHATRNLNKKWTIPEFGAEHTQKKNENNAREKKSAVRIDWR